MLKRAFAIVHTLFKNNHNNSVIFFVLTHNFKNVALFPAPQRHLAAFLHTVLKQKAGSRKSAGSMKVQNAASRQNPL